MLNFIKDRVRKYKFSSHPLWRRVFLVKQKYDYTKQIFQNRTNRVTVKLASSWGLKLPLNNYRVRLFKSQFGEDGVIFELVKRLKIEKGWFVELGASDGVSASNTFGLVQRNWQGVYIEMDDAMFLKLKEYCRSFQDRVVGVQEKVSLEPGHTLDAILSRTGVPKDFDVLSLDIDGNDYWVWKSSIYEPKIVVIEYNPIFHPVESKTIPYNPDFQFDGTGFVGASALALYKLGVSKGYTLVAFTVCNLIFLKNEYVQQAQVKVVDIHQVKRVNFHPSTIREFEEV